MLDTPLCSIVFLMEKQAKRNAEKMKLTSDIVIVNIRLVEFLLAVGRRICRCFKNGLELETKRTRISIDAQESTPEERAVDRPVF